VSASVPRKRNSVSNFGQFPLAQELRIGS
jgi:hypothetical protein